MPVDPTRASSSRRTQRKITEEELKDIELKRIRGELSCAECRRLKLRCDKKVPCSSCCRRGCESICPCGILSAGQGTRFILADTEQLHRKIADMSHRIRQLEDALAILQSSVSSERHPLLQDDLLKVKFGPEALDSRHTSPPEEEKITKQSIDALGTLTLGDSGEVKYFGRSAGSETLMMAEEEWDSFDDEDEKGRIALTPELENIANLFPFTSKRRPNGNSLELLESFLPTHERAWVLCESYLDHASLFFRPIKRDELRDTLLPSIYNAASTRVGARVAADASPGTDHSSESGSVDTNSPHALATLLFVFALGALLDLNLPPYNSEAEHYYNLGRAALSLRAVFDSPQVDTVQAMGLMATYHSLAGKKYSRDSAWCIMSVVAKLAQSIGLHRDSARWHMDAGTVQKRRTLFWEVFTADISHSLALGRPPSIHLSYADCEFPEDQEATLSDSGEMQNGFWRMKYAFGRDMFFAVAEATLTATSPSYETVLNLDRKVREISFPNSFKPYVQREDGEQEYLSSSLSLQGFYASQHRTVTMLYLHRSFFAQAMLDHPSNPLLSPFAPSFLTAYRSASVIIKASAHQFDRCAEMAMRVWFLMYHTFSAAVIVGTVVTRSPNSNVASSALLDLTQAVDLFERTALQSQRAKIALGVLRKLKDKAVRSYAQFSSDSIPHQPTTNPMNLPPTSGSPPREDVDDELAIFGGQTRVLSRKSRSKSSPTSAGTASPSSSAEGSVSPPTKSTDVELSPSAEMVPMTDVHPSLLEYLGPGSLRGDQGAPPVSIQPSTSYTSAQQTNNISNTNSNIQPYANFPAAKQMGEIYSSFMGFLANRSISNATTSMATPNVPSSILDPYRSMQAAGQSNWNGKSEDDMHILPQADNSFGWVPPAQRQGFVQTQQMAHVSNKPQVGPYPPISTNHTSAPSHPHPEPSIFGSASFSGGQPYHNHPPYIGPNYLSGGAAPVDPGSMVELGLLTESDIDSGWLSFMQDCGIMESGNSNGSGAG